MKTISVLFLFLLSILNCGIEARENSDPLPSWNEGSTKEAIINFVNEVTTEGSYELCSGISTDCNF